MKKLEKIKLEDVSVLNAHEMKSIVGGTGAPGNGCPAGTNDLECFHSCTILAENKDKAELIPGICKFLVNATCYCEEIPSSSGDSKPKPTKSGGF